MPRLTSIPVGTVGVHPVVLRDGVGSVHYHLRDNRSFDLLLTDAAQGEGDRLRDALAKLGCSGGLGAPPPIDDVFALVREDGDNVALVRVNSLDHTIRARGHGHARLWIEPDTPAVDLARDAGGIERTVRDGGCVIVAIGDTAAADAARWASDLAHRNTAVVASNPGSPVAAALFHASVKGAALFESNLPLEGDDADAVDRLRVWIRGLMDDPRLASAPEAWWLQFELGAVESLTNLIRHAYAGVPAKPIQVGADVREGGIVLRLSHRGQPFEPRRVGRPVMDTARTGGWGLYILQQTFDAVRHDTLADGSCIVTMAKSFPPTVL